MSSSIGNPDPLSSATEGITTGLLNWSKEQITIWTKKFNNRDIAFIRNLETIDLAKEMRKKGEWHVFSDYVKDKDLRILFQMGLTLRELESNNKKVKLKDLKEKIKNKYARSGLHIAYFVQNGLFSKYIGILLDKASTIQILANEIRNLFNSIDNTVAFISKDDDVHQKSAEIIAKIQVNTPETFIISSCKLTAMMVCENILDKVMQNISSNYKFESYSSDNKKIFFLKRKETEL